MNVLQLQELLQSRSPLQRLNSCMGHFIHSIMLSLPNSPRYLHSCSTRSSKRFYVNCRIATQATQLQLCLYHPVLIAMQEYFWAPDTQFLYKGHAVNIHHCHARTRVRYISGEGCRTQTSIAQLGALVSSFRSL